ncbi:unnamed protein product [Closterium sp. NIES-65]|nr:unnamed protein product [Closterium sp. NIES-65]
MSWLLNSLVGSPRADDDDDEDVDEEENDDTLLPAAGSADNPDSPGSAARDAAAAAGVRDDLTELQQSLTKHWRGVASFLTGEPRRPPASAPQPPASASASAALSASADDAASLDPPAPLSPEETAGLSRDEVRALRWRQELSRQAEKDKDKEKGKASAAAAAPPGRGGAAEDAQGAGEGGAEGEESEEDASARHARLSGVREDLAELSQRVKRGLTSVIRVVTGDDAAAGAGKGARAGGRGKARRGEGDSDSDGAEEEGREEEEEDDEEEGEEGEEGEEDEEEEDGGETLLEAAQEDIKAISSTLATGITGVGRLASRLFAATDAQLGRAEGSGGDGEYAEGAGAGMGEEEFGEAEVAVGVTADVVQFAQNLSGHPETWIEFPLPDEEDEEEDFEVAGEQEEHIEAVEARVPRLVALRMELTPQHLSERRFWKIYFVLLHSRIPPAAAARLSTPPILRARDQVLAALRQQSAAGMAGDSPSPSPSADTGPIATAAAVASTADQGSTMQAVTDAAGGGGQGAGSSADVAAGVSNVRDEDADDDWLEEESGAVLGGGGGGGPVGGGAGGVDDGEDVSFSDLEDEDEEGGKAKGENASVTAVGDGASGDGNSAVQGEQAQGSAGAAVAADAAAQTAAADGEAGDKDGVAEAGVSGGGAGEEGSKEAGKGGATERRISPDAVAVPLLNQVDHLFVWAAVVLRFCTGARPTDPPLASHAAHADVAVDAPSMSDLSLWSDRLRTASGGDAATPSLAPAPDPTNSVRTSRTDGSAPHAALQFPDTSHPASGSQAVPCPSPRHLSAAPPAAACPIAALPADVLLHCLIRLPRADWPRLRAVCRTWRRLVACPDFLRLRRADGRSESWLFAVEWMFKGGCSGQPFGSASGGGSSGAGVWGRGGRKGGGGTARGVGGSSVDLGDSGRREWGEEEGGVGDLESREEAGDGGNGEEVRDGDEESGGSAGAGSATAGDGHGHTAQDEVPPLAASHGHTATAQNRTRSRVLLLQQQHPQQRTAVSSGQRARSASLSPYTTAPASASPSLALLWAYDPAAKRWYSHGCLPPMRGICHSSTLLALGPCLLLLGGSCSSACCSPGGGACGPSRAVWRYNVVTGKARRLADMTCPRFNFAAAVLPSSGRIIVLDAPALTAAVATALEGTERGRRGSKEGWGGRRERHGAGDVSSSRASSEIERVDSGTNMWSCTSPPSAWRVVPSMLPSSVAGLVATRLTTANGQLVLTNHVAPMCHHVLQYLPQTNSWRDAGKLPVCGFRGFGVVGVDGHLLVEGGVEAAAVDGAVGLDPGRFLQRTPYVNAFQPRMWGVQEGQEVRHGRGSGRGNNCVRSSGGDGRGHRVRQGGDEVQEGMDGHGEVAVGLRADPAMGLLGRGMAENETSRQSVSHLHQGAIGGAEGPVWESEAGQAGTRENASTNMHAPAHEQRGNGISAPAGGHGDGEGVGGVEGSAGSEVVLQDAVWRPVRPFGNAGVPRVCQWCVVSAL